MSEKRVTHRHDRAAIGRRFVYVVRSRRSGGLSVGINLDPQQTCNFDCVYCEVIDRRAIARHVGRPPILAADEPTGNLDSKTGREILDLFHELHERGNSIMMVTHEEDVAREAKRVIHIRDGKVAD